MQLTTDTRVTPEQTKEAAFLDRRNKATVPEGGRFSFAALLMQTLSGATEEVGSLLPLAAPAEAPKESKPEVARGGQGDYHSQFKTDPNPEKGDPTRDYLTGSRNSGHNETDNRATVGVEHAANQKSETQQNRNAASAPEDGRSNTAREGAGREKSDTVAESSAKGDGGLKSDNKASKTEANLEVKSDTLKTLESLTDDKNVKKAAGKLAEKPQTDVETTEENRTEVKSTQIDAKKDLKKPALVSGEESSTKKVSGEGQPKVEEAQVLKADGKEVKARNARVAKEAASGERISWQVQAEAGRVEPKIKAADSGRLQSEMISKQSAQGLNKPIQAKTGASGQFGHQDLAGGLAQKGAAQLGKAAKAGSTAPPLTRHAGQNFDNLVQKIRMSVVDHQNGSVSMRLNPEHLGRVFVKFQLKDGKLNAQVQVENAAAQKLFASGVTELFQKFREAGIEVENFQLDVRDQANEHQASGEGRRREEGFATGGFGGSPAEDGEDGYGSDELAGNYGWDPGSGDALNIRA